MLDCSESTRTLLGVSKHDIEQGLIYLADFIHPDDLIELQSSAVQGALNTPTRYRLKSAHSGWCWVKDEHGFTPKEPMTDPQLSIVHDVSDEHEHRERASIKEAQMNMVLDGTKIGIWEHDFTNHHTFIDPAWAEKMGLSSTKIQDMPQCWQDRIHPDDIKPLQDSVWNYVRGFSLQHEQLIRVKDAKGNWLHILDRARIAERGQDGRVSRLVGTQTDVSELVEARQKAEGALETRDRFFSAVSHDLRTPIHAILGMAELLIPEMQNQERRAKVEVIQDSSSYLLSMVKDLLDVSKIEDGKLALQLQTVDASVITDKVCALFSDRATQKGLSIHKDFIDSQDTWLHIDEVRLMQVLQNLMSNAVKYTATGSVNVSILEKNTDLIIRIKDTGIGIENVSLAFLPYSQENQRRSDDEHSTGLGLSIVKNVCELMEVGISVQSTVGQGTCFDLTFHSTQRRKPLAKKPQPIKAPNPANWRAMNVLIVDDNEINRIVAKAMLKVPNVKCLEACNGVEALKVLEQTPIDIVFMDLHMPQKGGLRTTFEIRQNPRLKDVIVIGLSANAYDEAKEKCLNVGMNDYATKPFDRQTMLNKIEQWVKPTQA